MDVRPVWRTVLGCPARRPSPGSGFRVIHSDLGGAMWIRTPDLLHAMQVRRPSCQRHHRPLPADLVHRRTRECLPVAGCWLSTWLSTISLTPAVRMPQGPLHGTRWVRRTMLQVHERRCATTSARCDRSRPTGCGSPRWHGPRALGRDLPRHARDADTCPARQGATVQIATMVISLSPATRRMSPGSLVTTAISCPADADWITAPRCASATETPVRWRMAAAVLARAASSGTSAMRRRLGNTHAGEVRSHPASTRTAVGTVTSTVAARRFRLATTWATLTTRRCLG